MNSRTPTPSDPPSQSATTPGRAVHTVELGVRVLLILLILATTVLACSMRRVQINGSSTLAWSRLTPGRCATIVGADLRPGNLYSASEDVLTDDATPEAICIAPRKAVLGQTIRPGDSLQSISGRDAMEPLKYPSRPISPLPGQHDSVGRQPGSAKTGVARVRGGADGSTSGQTNGVQLAALTPAVPQHSDAVGRIALTFDDGPNPTYTPRILEILRHHDAHATFFTVGTFAKKYPDVVGQILSGGNEVGCHTWGHPDCTGLSDAQIRKQLSWWKSACPAHESATVRWFRPPYGATSSRVKAICSEVGYRTITWTGDTHDWMQPGVDAIYNRALQAARDGACILMHDGGGPRSQTVAAVKMLVPELQRRGYELVTLSRLHGYEPASNSDLRIHTETGTLELTEAESDLQIRINATPVDLPIEPVEIDGQLLLPARPTLPMLGCPVRFDTSSRRLTIVAPEQTLRMNLNRCTLTVGEREVWMAVPPVFFRGHSMIPLWLLVDHCGATAAYDPLHTTLHLRSRYAPSALSLHADNDSPVRISQAKDAPWQDRLSILR